MTVGEGLARVTVRKTERDPRAAAAATVLFQFGGRKVRLRGYTVQKTGTIYRWCVPTVAVPGDAKRSESFELDERTAREVELAGLRTWERLRLEIGRRCASDEVALPAVGDCGDPRPRRRDWEAEAELWA